MNCLAFRRLSISHFVLNNRVVSMSIIDGMKFSVIGNNYHAKNDSVLFRFRRDNHRCIYNVYRNNAAMCEFDACWDEEPKNLAFLADNSDSKYNPYNRLSAFK